jgi:hypothetical protein
MNNVPLFIAGFLITLLVVFALGLLFYGARLDGQYQDETREATESEEPSRS